jgi:hypothetical protein
MNTTEELIELTKTDIVAFEEALSACLRDRAQFEIFLDPRLVTNTLAWLESTRVSLNEQLVRYRDSPNRNGDWEQRTLSFRGLLSSRIKTAEIRIPWKWQERGWKEFAHKLCAAIDEFGDEALLDMLDEIESPFPDLSAGEWFERRLVKRGLLEPDVAVAA